MNKQQLAARIWKTADQMRAKIDASEYKDYILGFIFYKYLSEREVAFLKSNGWDDEDVASLSEDDARDVAYVQDNLGYFIAHENLYDTWIEKGSDFDVQDVDVALKAFSRLVPQSREHIFKDVFRTLEVGLTKLGDNSQHQTKAIHDLLVLIKPIPMGGKQDYDVLGFIYEYLIYHFAASAGKAAGEFYTPAPVSELMSDIIADHLKGRDSISIYDPAAGSGSLLLSIGESIAKANGDAGRIKYYAQELKQGTYNLCRMNLVMRGVAPDNIETKNADTLIDDWPLESDDVKPLRVDSCALNPPYSLSWNQPKEHDPRFDYGLAPKSKADYAFLLHSLYHLAPGGIMTIVLPHGVLFRGNEEEAIRRKLVDNRHVDAVIGLPANIFFGTGIPTIVMVLKRDREAEDVLFIDGSKCFVKNGKKNDMRAEDVRRIFDAYKAREDVPGFAHLASFEEIEANGYNMNIPRYVDSSDPAEPHDVYATMFGGVPSTEIDSLSAYWAAWPTLRAALFHEEDGYAVSFAEDFKAAVESDPSVADWRASFSASLDGWDASLASRLLDDPESIALRDLGRDLERELFERLRPVPLVDEYAAFQRLHDAWGSVTGDVETVESEGFLAAARAVDPNMVERKKDSKSEEAQDKNEPWVGRILPFPVVQRLFLSDELDEAARLEAELSRIQGEIESVAGDVEDPAVLESVTKDDGEGLDPKAVAAYVEGAVVKFVPEVDALREYVACCKGKPGVKAVREYIASHGEISWAEMKASKNGTYTQKEANARIALLLEDPDVPEGTDLSRLLNAKRLFAEAKRIEKDMKEAQAALVASTKGFVESISEEDAKKVLFEKWVAELIAEIKAQEGAVVSAFLSKAEALSMKYSETMEDVEAEIRKAESDLAGMLGMLTGGDRDMAGVRELMSLLGGE